MDKIYSRKRLLIPKLRKTRCRKRRRILFSKKQRKGLLNNSDISNSNNGNYSNNISKKIISRKSIKTLVVVIIAIFIANRIISTIEPTIDVLCINMAKSIATKISNDQATVVMRRL